MSTIDCSFTVSGGEGPVLFLIHGIGADQSVWRFMMPELNRHFQVITYDLRGHGNSPMPNGEFGLSELVDDLERVREQTGIERAHFAGHSLGGMIAPAYARKYPNHVQSLILLSTAAGRSKDDSKKVWAVVNAMIEQGVDKVLPTLIDRWFTDSFIELRPDIVEGRLKQVLDTDTDVFLNVFKIYAGTEMLPWLGEIEKATLVLTGEQDGGCNPRLNRLIAEAIDNSKLVILPNYKHSILLEAGPEVASHIVCFIKELG